MKIDKNVPIPLEALGHGGAKYPFRHMEVGDSIFIEGKEAGQRAKSAAFMMSKRTRLVFRVWRENNGVRVWRVA